MIFLYDVLSVWELAHRWYNHDPNMTNPKALPLEVQDLLRFLTRKMARHELRSCSSSGVVNTIDLDVMRLEEFIDTFHSEDELSEDELSEDELSEDELSEDELSEGELSEGELSEGELSEGELSEGELSEGELSEGELSEGELSEGEAWTKYESYLDYMNRKMQRHNENIEGLERCFEKREYDKDKLDNLFVVQHDFAKFCQRESLELPKFWYPQNYSIEDGGVIEDEVLHVQERRLTESQEDRIRCRAIASLLWGENPKLTIVEITEHQYIQKYGNGRLYKGRGTIRNWIKDLDPREESERTGRPPKKPNPDSE